MSRKVKPTVARSYGMVEGGSRRWQEDRKSLADGLIFCNDSISLFGISHKVHRSFCIRFELTDKNELFATDFIKFLLHQTFLTDWQSQTTHVGKQNKDHVIRILLKRTMKLTYLT